ncbi:nucleoside hydrolase [Candidatus Pacearchaeota archaeon]|nr:nucleoside hydrolase [Candidatus Pacearchaeota archaeon]
MVKKILVLTDIGSDPDDALSILAMVNVGLPIEAIYTTNAPCLDFRSYIAKHLINLSGKDIVVAQGESNPIFPLVNPYTFCENCYVDDCFIDEEESEASNDIIFKELEEVDIIPNGLEDLVLRLEKEKKIIFSLAPLTNVGKLLLKYPSLAINIERMYIMGGSIEGSIEHNFRHDIRAAEVVFESEVPLTIITKETCEKYRMLVSYLDNISTNAGLYVKKMAKGYAAAKIAFELNDKQIYSLLEDLLIKGSGGIKIVGNSKDIRRKVYESIFLLSNINDPIYGASDTEDFFKKYQQIIDLLRSSEIDYEGKNILPKVLEMVIPKSLSVADVFIPYCYLYPERLRVKKGNLIGGERIGETRFVEGDRCDVVFDIDYDHFDTFIQTYIK